MRRTPVRSPAMPKPNERGLDTEVRLITSAATTACPAPFTPCQPMCSPVTCFAVQPIAFHIGTFEVHWYGILVMIGFVAGLWTAGRRGVRDGFSPEVFQ